ncbi:MAG: hypothetical protein CUN53_19290 [Phototrophicales bacterium]|nr:MAG: hypothetical protein CUN53_19290 [Phototrophicales bacterium]
MRLTLYRGCMLYLFAFFIAVFSAMLGRSYGLVGMIAPWIAVGLVYWLVDTALLVMIGLAENISSQSD